MEISRIRIDFLEDISNIEILNESLINQDNIISEDGENSLEKNINDIT